MSNPQTLQDQNYKSLQLFVPNVGVSLVSPLTPTSDIVIKVASDVTITLDGIDVLYEANSVFGLRKGVTYTLSATTDAHTM